MWRDGVVPYYVSTNPYLAACLADILVAYARDAAGPVDVVELGGGSGKLAFHVLRELSLGSGDAPPVRYVLTDVVPDLLDFWIDHPRLRAFAAAGTLDVGLLDVEHPAPVRLARSGDVLGAGPAERPLIVLASYCLDSVSQDVFFVDVEGALFECLATYSGEEGRPDEALISYELRPCPKDRYGDPALDALLEGYRTTARGVTFTFPVAALRCFGFFAAGWPEGLLALVGDHGFVRPADSLPLSAVEPTRHGSVSWPVNFGAIGDWFVRRGGAAWHPANRPQSYNVSGFTLGRPAPAAAAAYRKSVDDRDPDAFFTMKKALQRRYAELSLREAVTFLRLSHWDPDIFIGMYPHIIEGLEDLPSAADGDELMKAVHAVWDNSFPLRGDELAFGLASVSYAAGHYEEALELFGHAIAETGGSVDCWLNLALCHEMLGERERAIDCVYQALAADPSVEAPTELLARLRG